MFGIGAQEMLLIGALCLLVFGPARLSGMARELGGFVRKARETADEFKAGLELDGGQEDPWEEPGEYTEERWESEQEGLEVDSEPPENREAGSKPVGPEETGEGGPERQHREPVLDRDPYEHHAP